MRKAFTIQSLILILCISTAAFAQSDRKPLFGELHIHTKWSFDAYVFGVRNSPDDAYNFAKGKPLEHPLGKTYQLSRPWTSWPSRITAPCSAYLP